MTNVCYLVDAPYVGGAERYVSMIASHLDRTRFRPSVLIRQPIHPRSGFDEWLTELADAGVPTHGIPMNLPFTPHHVIGIHRAIERERPHIAHVNIPGPHDGQMGLLAPLSRMAGAVAVVVTEHLPMEDTLWKRSLVKRLSYRWVDRVLTVCRANVPYLVGKQGVDPQKVVVIPNGIPVQYGANVATQPRDTRVRFGIPADRVAILFVGNIIRRKGLHRLVRVLCQLGDLPWHLVVVGEGPERAHCQAMLARGAGDERGTFLGRLEEDDVEAVLGSSDVLALPSRIEGMPYVILEAMASSLPVVATRVFGIPEMVEDGETGVLVGVSDEAGLGEALSRLIRDENLRRVMGARAKERFEREFTLERQVRRIEDLYARLVRGSAAGGVDG